MQDRVEGLGEVEQDDMWTSSTIKGPSQLVDSLKKIIYPL